MRRLFAIFLFAILFGGYAFSYDFSAVCESGQTLYYNITSNVEPYTVEVTREFEEFVDLGYDTYPTGNLEIPESVEYNSITYSVTRIGDHTFRGCSGLTSVTIPNSVTSIGDGAFYWCSGLTEPVYNASIFAYFPNGYATDYTIPDGIQQIASSAFNNCSGLTSITIPNSVTSIGVQSFYECSGLTSVTIPNSVTSIGNSAFSCCRGLTSVTIPNSVTSIGDGAFYNCSRLTEITIPNSVTSIGNSAFSGCNGLSSITIESDADFQNANLCFSKDEFKYQVLGKNSVEINSNQYSGNVVIPETVTAGNIFTVTSIGSSAFNDAFNSRELTSVTIPNSVTSIGRYAFSDCSGLTSVTIPNSVTSIGENAFYNCSGLTLVTIGNGVTSIGYGAFRNCNGLVAVYYTGGVEKWCGISFGSTEANPLNCAHNLYIDNELVTDLVIPNTVTEIKSCAFYSATCIVSVTIPSSVTSISANAFGANDLTSIIVDSNNGIYDSRDNCNAIIETETNTLVVGCKTTTIPSSVTSIGRAAFYECSGLTSVTIPNSVTSIGYVAFHYCSGLTSVTIPNSVTSIDNQAFSIVRNIVYSGTATGSPWGALTVNGYIDGILVYSDESKTNLTGCNTLATEVTIPNSVRSIGFGAFYNCSRLTEITIPDSVTSIGGYAFSGCSGLSTVNFNSTNCTSMSNSGNPSFDNCTASATLNIGENVTNIPDFAFRGFSGLETVTIGNSVESIGEGAFTECSSLTSISIPNSVINIGRSGEMWGPFERCSNLTSVTIPNSVTIIGDYAFNRCSGLTSVTIGNSVTSIGRSAFYDCSGLTTVNYNATNCTVAIDGICGNRNITTLNIGEEVETIPDEAFEGCSGLTGTLTIPSSVTSIGASAFADCNGLTGSLTLHDSITNIGNKAFYRCSGFTSVTIPNSITSIGEGTFFGCSGLTGDLIIPNSVTNIGNKNDTYGAFEMCRSLTSITIPSSVSCIGAAAFNYCSNLTTVNFNATNCTSMGGRWYSAFKKCTSLTTINIGENVTNIPDSAFRECDSLTTINYNAKNCNLFGYDNGISGNTNITTLNIGDSVRVIPANAFKDCSGIVELEIPDSVQRIGREAFANTGWYNAQPDSILYLGNWCLGYKGTMPTVSLHFADSTRGIADASFENCNGIASVTLPSSITNVGEDAFAGCYSIDTIVAQSEEPPMLNNSSFDYDALAATRVIVPCGTAGIYRNDNKWGRFSDIQNDTSVNFVVDIQSTNEDMGSVTGSGTYLCEAEVNLEATPTEHYHFVSWSDGNTDNPRTITVVGDTTYTATFAIDQHTVMVVSNNSTKGTVSGGGTFDYGEEREIEAIANEGYRFLSWNDNNTDNPRTITVSGDTLYIATFEVDDTPQPVYVTIADTACGSYTWNDETYTETNSYYQTFTASNSADSIVRLDLVIYPLPQPEITIDGILDACNPESASVTLSTGEYEEYNWSTNETTGTATVTAPGNYYVEVVDTNGCHGLSEMATVGYSSLLTVAPQLKYVGLRYSGTVSCNMVQWDLDNADTVGVRGFEIYREDTETAIYTLVQRIVKPLQRSWTDPTADFTARAYRYKICAIDECGGMSPMSEPHKTMHLTINRGAGTTWNLIWSHYEGVEFGTYEIYRGTSSRNMVRIAVIPSSINSYTDNTNTLEEGMFYQIKIVGSSGAKNEEFELYSNVVANEYVEDYTISVLSNNENFGVAAGSGTYPAGLDVTLMAIPNDGYEFVSWNDGNTENPRTITVSGNAAYVATFGEVSSAVTNYTITAVPANPSQGTVTGGGIYPEGTEITIEAIAAEGYEFISWSDDNTENPRIITVTADAMFIASFAPATDIEESVTTEINIFPNPAKDILNITSSETISEIAIVNVMGQVVRRIEVNSDNAVCNVEELKAGVYMVRIRTASATLSQRKFVKK